MAAAKINIGFGFYTMIKIYTKTGDSGETSLLGGGRVTKDCITMHVVGELDELNAVLGVVGANFSAEFLELKKQIEKIQTDLFKVGAEMVSLQSEVNKNLVKVGESEIVELENGIDKMWTELPELKNFILPGGSIAGAHLHQARTICRRAERALVGFGREQNIRPEIYQYLNRLSDWLFAAARWANLKLKIDETKV